MVQGLRERPFNVLVLDDDACEAKLLGDALVDIRDGLTVHNVSSPDEAIRFLYCDAEFASAPRANLVFLDYRMPSNGGPVLSILKGDPGLRSIPVIAFCVDASHQHVRDIYDRNANCCISKPLQAEDFNDLLRQVLSFWMDVAFLLPSKTDS